MLLAFRLFVIGIRNQVSGVRECVGYADGFIFTPLSQLFALCFSFFALTPQS